MENILGIYNRDIFNNSFRVGTPDPKKYHDISTIQLESIGGPMIGRMPGNHGYSGLRGVIIPRAVRGGWKSSGFDHFATQKVFIDPQLTNKQFVVDMAKVQQDPGRMLAAITKSYQAGFEDPADAAVAAWAEFAEPIGDQPHPDELTVSQPQEESVSNQRLPPLGAPGVYVVPKASREGGQIRPASFGKQAAHAPSHVPAHVPAHVPVSAQEQPKVMLHDGSQAEVRQSHPAKPEPVVRALQSMRSLRSELSGERPVGGYGATPRKVIFELPIPGQPNSSMGQFTGFYHDVVKHEGLLILVYDHAQPSQVVWFPPVLEHPETHDPIAVALMVSGTETEPETLYLAYPTGIRFPFGSYELCVLTIEQEKPKPAQ